MNRFRASYSGVKLSMLYMDDNHVKDIATNTDFGMALSPDGTKVVYSRYDERNKPQLYAYDWKKGTHRKLKDDHAYWREFIGDDVYVAYDDDQYKRSTLPQAIRIRSLPMMNCPRVCQGSPEIRLRKTF